MAADRVELSDASRDALATAIAAELAGLSVSQDNGTPITGAAMPAGGVGLFGWLSALWKAITDRLPAALVGGRLSVDGSGVTQPVASNDDTIITALAVSISPAYTAKDSIGGKITIAGAIRLAGTTSILHSLMLLDRSGQKPTGTILLFGADPVAATITDNALFVSSTDDVKIIASIPVTAGDWVIPGATKALANIRNIGALVEAASGTTLYAAFICDNTPTFVAVDDVQAIWGFLR